MDGLLFYWLLWMNWVIVTFLLPQKRINQLLSCWILIVITASGLTLPVFLKSMNVSLLLLISSSFSLLVFLELLEKVKLLVIAFITGVAAAAMKLYVILDPAGILMDARLMFAIVTVGIPLFFIRSWKHRLLVLIIAVCCGESLLLLHMTYVGLPYMVDSLKVLDEIAVVISLSNTWAGIAFAVKLSEHLFEKRMSERQGKI